MGKRKSGTERVHYAGQKAKLNKRRISSGKKPVGSHRIKKTTSGGGFNMGWGKPGFKPKTYRNLYKKAK